MSTVEPERLLNDALSVRRVRWTPLATADLNEISDYLGQNLPRYRQPIIGKIYETLHTLRTSPWPGRAGLHAHLIYRIVK